MVENLYQLGQKRILPLVWLLWQLMKVWFQDKLLIWLKLGKNWTHYIKGVGF